MPAVGISAEQHARVFGPRDDLDITGHGRSRKCKVCDGWHRLDQPWPHNCRTEAPRSNPKLATPQIAPPFQAFKTGQLDNAKVITSRAEKAEYMRRNDLVEYDTGVSNEETWVEKRECERGIVRDIKRFIETDPLNLPPDLKAQPMNEGGSLDDGTEISASDIEVVK